MNEEFEKYADVYSSFIGIAGWEVMSENEKNILKSHLYKRFSTSAKGRSKKEEQAYTKEQNDNDLFLAELQVANDATYELKAANDEKPKLDEVG